VAHAELEGLRSKLCSLISVSIISCFPRRSFFPRAAMSTSREHVPSSFDNHLRYAECCARQIGATDGRFNSPQRFDPMDPDPRDRPLLYGLYSFCIRRLATSLAASLAPRELPPTRLCDGIQVRAKGLSDARFCLIWRTKFHPFCHPDPNRNHHHWSHISRWM
jgi:hypothetical protein